MRLLLALALFTELTSTAGNAITCDPVEVKSEGVLRRKCKWKIGLVKNYEFPFFVETQECDTSFRITGNVGKNEFDKIITEEDNKLKLPGIPFCDEVSFSDIITGEDGLKFCPKLECPLIRDAPDCIDLREPDPCTINKSCEDCSANPICGWCYTDQICRKSNTLGNSDQCDYCEDFSKKCRSCSTNCDGHGECDHGQCTCAIGWSGAPDKNKPELERCDTYVENGNCDNVETVEGIALQWGDYTKDSDHVHAMLSFTNRVEAVSIIGIDPTEIFVSFDTPSNGAVRLSDIISGSAHQLDSLITCLPQSSKAANVMISPPLFGGNSLWFAVTKSVFENSKPKVTVDLMYCRGKFSGFPCNSILTEIYPWDNTFLMDDLDDTQIVHSVEVGVPAKGYHYIQFELPADVSEVTLHAEAQEQNVVVDSYLTKLAQQVEGIKSKDSITVKNPTPSPYWGVALRNTESSMTRVNVKLTFKECSDAVSCGYAEDVGTERSIEETWQKGEKEYVVSKRVKLGTQRLVIATHTSENAMLRAKFGSRVSEDEVPEFQVTADEELVILYPQPGLWYFSLFSSASLLQDDTINFIFKDSKCAACDESHCTLSTLPMMLCQVAQCSPAGTLSTGTCSQTPNIPDTPMPPTVKLTTTPLTTTPQTKVPDTTASPTVIVPSHSKGHKAPVVGIIIVLLLCVVGFFAGSKYRSWKLTRDHINGGYGFAPGVQRGGDESIEDHEMTINPSDDERDINFMSRDEEEHEDEHVDESVTVPEIAIVASNSDVDHEE